MEKSVNILQRFSLYLVGLFCASPRVTMPIFGHHCIRGQERERSCNDSDKCHLNHDFSRTSEGLPLALQLVCEVVSRILIGHFYIHPPPLDCDLLLD